MSNPVHEHSFIVAFTFFGFRKREDKTALADRSQKMMYNVVHCVYVSLTDMNVVLDIILTPMGLDVASELFLLSMPL